jgi:hypothetical protein
MSRSWRTNPICGITGASSEKDDKRRANKLLRRRVRHAIQTHSEVFPVIREVSNVWGFAKDGKQYCTTDKKVMRK